ncbi:tetratricopeptide repeat protein [Acidovorax cavernicola]|uniref:Tetratricopeptide repeat protein n=1 Tax=Acidovorax cavernicola TaxID=1675792 RepID=A0A9X8GWR7_9BURK|nr:tetratricopeptide repeat protein [Acidovorax cavernicola]RIX83210.1 tetratricopeptide repeat protein [Acidovorax cavernicola]
MPNSNRKVRAKVNQKRPAIPPSTITLLESTFLNTHFMVEVELPSYWQKWRIPRREGSTHSQVAGEPRKWQIADASRFIWSICLGCMIFFSLGSATAQIGRGPSEFLVSSAVEIGVGPTTFEGVVVAVDQVATPCHRLADAPTPLSVRLLENKFSAELVAADEDRNVCLLQVTGLKAPVTQFGRTRDSSRLTKVHVRSQQDGLLRRSDMLVGYFGKVMGGLYLAVAQSLTEVPFQLRDGTGLYDEQGRLVGLIVMEQSETHALSMALPVEWIEHVQERKPGPRQSLSPVPWMNQSRALDAKGNRDGRLQNSLGWVEASPQSAWAWNELGNAHMGTSIWTRGTKAISAYQRAIEADPQLGMAWSGLGNAYRLSTTTAQAIGAFETATRVDPTDSAAWRSLAELYKKNDQRERAMEAFNLAARSGVGNDRALALVGLAPLYGDDRKAIQALQEAVMADNRFALAWQNLGSAWGKIGDTRRSIGAYEMALQINPRDGKVWARLGEAYVSAQQPDAALKAYRAATAFDPGNGVAWKWQGVHYMEKKEYWRAVSAFTEAIKNGESTAQSYVELGAAFQEDGQAGKAEESFLKAVELAPMNAEPNVRLSQLYRAAGRAGDSLKAAEGAIRIDPKNTVALELLDSLRRGKGR